MKAVKAAGRAGGFTLIELLVTLAILAALGAMVVPLAQVQVQRAREQELRIALRELRAAIDAYKRAADEGRVRRDAGSFGGLQRISGGTAADKTQPTLVFGRILDRRVACMGWRRVRQIMQ